MKRALDGLLALVSVGLFLGGLFFILELHYARGGAEARGSTLRSDPRGLRALYLLLERTGHHPSRLRSPVPPPGPGILFCIEPYFSTEERDRDLVSWVKGGGTIVLTPSEEDPGANSRRRGESLARRLGLHARREKERPPVWNRFPPEARTVSAEGRGPGLLTFPLEKGRVWALADAEQFENGKINQAGNLELLLASLGEEKVPVYFDEYRHGLGENRGLAYVLARYNLLPTAFALLAFLGLLAWRTTPAEAGPPPESDLPAAIRDSLVDARAGVYARTLAPADAVKLLERDFRHELSRRLHSGKVLSFRETLKVVTERTPGRGATLRSALAELGSLKANPPARLEELVPFSRHLADLLEEIR